MYASLSISRVSLIFISNVKVHGNGLSLWWLSDPIMFLHTGLVYFFKFIIIPPILSWPLKFNYTENNANWQRPFLRLDDLLWIFVSKLTSSEIWLGYKSLEESDCLICSRLLSSGSTDRFVRCLSEDYTEMTVCVPVMPAVLINMKVYIYLKMKIDTDRSLH